MRARVPLEDNAGVVATDLLGDEVGDIAAAASRPGDRIHERQRLLRQGDVRSHETHDVTPCVNMMHIY